jgi:serine protease Do
MKLLKITSLLVALGGAAALGLVAAPSVFDHFGSRVIAEGRQDRAPERRARALTILDGRGAQIGVSTRDLEAAEADRRKVQGGVVIDEVQPDSPAERAGLKPSDVIVEFDGERVRSARQFSRLVRETAPDRTVSAGIVRNGQRSDVKIMPSEGRSADVLIDGDVLREKMGDLGRFADRLPPLAFDFDFDLHGLMSPRGSLGVTVTELSGQLASYFNAKNGVLVAAVAEGSAAEKAGLQAGDVITSVNNERIDSRGDLMRALRGIDEGGEVTIGIVRDKKESSVTAKIEAPRRRSRPTRPAEGI